MPGPGSGRTAGSAVVAVLVTFLAPQARRALGRVGLPPRQGDLLAGAFAFQDLAEGGSAGLCSGG